MLASAPLHADRQALVPSCLGTRTSRWASAEESRVAEYAGSASSTTWLVFLSSEATCMRSIFGLLAIDEVESEIGTCDMYPLV